MKNLCGLIYQQFEIIVVSNRTLKKKKNKSNIEYGLRKNFQSWPRDGSSRLAWGCFSFSFKVDSQDGKAWCMERCSILLIMQLSTQESALLFHIYDIPVPICVLLESSEKCEWSCSSMHAVPKGNKYLGGRKSYKTSFKLLFVVMPC